MNVNKGARIVSQKEKVKDAKSQNQPPPAPSFSGDSSPEPSFSKNNLRNNKAKNQRKPLTSEKVFLIIYILKSYWTLDVTGAVSKVVQPQNSHRRI